MQQVISVNDRSYQLLSQIGASALGTDHEGRFKEKYSQIKMRSQFTEDITPTAESRTDVPCDLWFSSYDWV